MPYENTTFAEPFFPEEKGWADGGGGAVEWEKEDTSAKESLKAPVAKKKIQEQPQHRL